MDQKKTALERSFELAESGKPATIEEIRRTLTAEGYATNQLTGSSLLSQLRKLIRVAKGETAS